MPPEPTPAPRPRQTRVSNPNWRGGRLVASNGYVLVRVGVGHRLADVRGYAYEHRIVAERKIGCPLEPSEIVHHVNGDKADNRPENLEVVAGHAEHRLRHRTVGLGRRLPGEANPIVPCACGCGESLARFDEFGRPREYVSGHNPMPSPIRDAILAALQAAGVASNRQIAASTGIADTTVRITLSRLKQQGRVIHVRTGVWASKDNNNG